MTQIIHYYYVHTSYTTLGRKQPLLTIHLQHMCLIDVFIAVGMATVVSHMDGCHLGNVQGAVIPKVLQGKGGGEKKWN